MAPTRRWLILGATTFIAVVLLVAYMLRPQLSDTDTTLDAASRTPISIATSSVGMPPSGYSFTYEIRNTPEERRQGLSGRRDVPANYGMLFVFDTYDHHGFWMKDMYVPIDIIWLSDNGTILGIEHAVQPDTYPKVFYPPQPVRYVLETRAGEASAQGWTIGTAIPAPPL